MHAHSDTCRTSPRPVGRPARPAGLQERSGKGPGLGGRVERAEKDGAKELDRHAAREARPPRPRMRNKHLLVHDQSALVRVILAARLKQPFPLRRAVRGRAGIASTTTPARQLGVGRRQRALVHKVGAQHVLDAGRHGQPLVQQVLVHAAGHARRGRHHQVVRLGLTVAQESAVLLLARRVVTGPEAGLPAGEVLVEVHHHTQERHLLVLGAAAPHLAAHLVINVLWEALSAIVCRAARGTCVS
mmetsp:Transcript_47378/g.153081  ORF Transcript_47378/g.153081 Transcript_47378/m.153081 type:complete len:244 (-) Transcript_47378:1020-1751(-)